MTNEPQEGSLCLKEDKNPNLVTFGVNNAMRYYTLVIISFRGKQTESSFLDVEIVDYH